MRVLFLYTELADYTIACLRALKKSDSQVEVMVIHYPVNPEAPFQLKFDGIGEFHSTDKVKIFPELNSVVTRFQPGIIICSGWSNKQYLKICRGYYGRIPTVLTMDNHWQGTLKQQLLSVVAKFSLHKVFSSCWVPGDRQVMYARKLGFQSNNIFTGFYCCDLERFNRMFELNQQKKELSFPKKLICVARYIPSKNYSTLWNAFIRWQKGKHDGWELWCAGTGSEYPVRIEHSGIRHLGFVSPEHWDSIVGETGVFILPSLFEPWGVVVQEFAAAGFPLILSQKVGSSTQFLKGSNGCSFDPESEDELIACFEKISSLSATELFKMGQISNFMANQLSLENWAGTIKQIYRQHKSQNA
jgi:glycosyltransferase involved in cell wall biosynthesis